MLAVSLEGSRRPRGSSEAQPAALQQPSSARRSSGMSQPVRCRINCLAELGDRQRSVAFACAGVSRTCERISAAVCRSAPVEIEGQNGDQVRDSANIRGSTGGAARSVAFHALLKQLLEGPDGVRLRFRQRGGGRQIEGPLGPCARSVESDFATPAALKRGVDGHDLAEAGGSSPGCHRP